MACYLVLSSQVAHGHVGLSAIVPTLQALGHDVIGLPTVLLSNHPGHAKVAGQPIDPTVLGQMLDALADNGRLESVDAVLTGYLPSPAHVQLAARTVNVVRRQRAGVIYFCDPVLGDDPKGLYIDQDAAAAIRTELLPLADCLSPNRFELAWLSRHDVTSATAAVAAARSLGSGRVVATSIPSPDDALLTLQIDCSTGTYCRVQRRQRAPHGTGDFLSALLLAGRSLGQAVASVDMLIEHSQDRDELSLIAAREAWLNAAALAEVPL